MEVDIAAQRHVDLYCLTSLLDGERIPGWLTGWFASGKANGISQKPMPPVPRNNV